MATQQHYAGAAAETYVAMQMLLNGYDVFTPMMTQSSADMIVLRDGKALKVQVKKLTDIKVGDLMYQQVRIQGRTNNTGWCREYSEDAFDYLAITNLKDVWMIPWRKVWCLKSLTIGGSGRRRGWDVDEYKLAQLQ
ncbi:hypothetical protein ZK1_40 [Klebsiella phage vB_KpnP_ZK1]|nr:hypothetical protein ZK1_40 [Klebsiella phage vB_KpnP_ZK1]